MPEVMACAHRYIQASSLGRADETFKAAQHKIENFNCAKLKDDSQKHLNLKLT